MMHHIDLMQQFDDTLDVFCVGFPNHGAKLLKKAEMQKQSAKKKRDMLIVKKILLPLRA